MPPIVVEPEVLAGAGESIGGVGDELGAAVSALAGGLPNEAMAGHDRAGLAFGQAYQQAAQALLDAGVAAANAGRQVGFGVEMSATNYSRADASSTIGGVGTALPSPAPPGQFDTPSVPSPFGGGVAEPFLWSMVQMLVGDVWPNGYPAQLRAAAGGWQTFASTLSGVSGQLAGASATISGQQIPEGGAITSAVSELGQGISEIAGECGKLATQLVEFAADVESAQNAVRNLLSRLSPSGMFDGLKALFTGDALEELREIAFEIKAVLNNLKRQADARQQTLQDVTQMLDDAVVSLQQKARREFTHYLAEDVGNSVATAFDFQTNLNEGVIKGGIGALEDIQQLNPLRFAYDFDGAKETWGALAETAYYANPTTAIMDPQGAFEHGKEMLPGLVHAEDWTRDRPGLGLGEVVFDVGSAFTGAGAARTGTRAAGAVADAADEAAPGVRAAVVDNVVAETAPITGRAGSIADNLHDITDDIPTNAAPNPTRPAIPPSLVEPPPNAPMPHGVPESPAPDGPDSTGARVPDSTPLDRAAVGPAASAPVDLTPISPAPQPTTTGHAADAPPAAPPHLPTSTAADASPPGADSTGPTGTADHFPGSSAPPDRPSGSSAGDHNGSGPGDQSSTIDSSNGHPASHEQSGDGWQRIDDKDVGTRYGEPLEEHWESGEYPTPNDVNRSTFNLIERPDEPYGHDSDGHALSKQGYDERYNQIGTNGEHWNNYPPNDGAVPRDSCFLRFS